MYLPDCVFSHLISIRKLLEGGVVDKFVHSMRNHRPARLSSKTGRTQQVSIAFTFPVIAILIAGFFASIVAFIIEIEIPCKRKKQVKKIKVKIRTQRMPYIIIVKEKKKL